jgi:hypothetical protein
MPLGVFSTLFMGCLTPFVDALTLAFEAVGPPRQLLAVRLFGYALAYSFSDSFLNLFDRFLLFTDLAICDLRRYLRFDASGSQIWTFRLEGHASCIRNCYLIPIWARISVYWVFERICLFTNCQVFAYGLPAIMACASAAATSGSFSKSWAEAGLISAGPFRVNPSQSLLRRV